MGYRNQNKLVERSGHEVIVVCPDDGAGRQGLLIFCIRNQETLKCQQTLTLSSKYLLLTISCRVKMPACH